MKRAISQCTETRSRVAAARTLAQRAGLLGAFALPASTQACTGVVDDAEARLGADSAALQDGSSTTLTLGAGYSEIPPPPGTAPTGDPALCAPDPHMFVVFQSGGPSGAYWGASAAGPGGPSWAGYGAFAFSSAPATAPLPAVMVGVAPNQHRELRFLVLGRRTSDGKIYWSEGKVLSSGSYPPFTAPAPLNPTTPFTKINDNVFSGAYGVPAIGTSIAGNAIMAYVGLDSNNQPQVYVNPKPYNGNWQPRSTAPLPAGWTPVGTPAVTWGWQNLFTIVVRGKNSSNQSALFRAFFNGTDFANPYSTDPKKFSQITLYSGSADVQGNPAVEWDSELGVHTVYYRSRVDFYEFSFYYDTAAEQSRWIIGPTKLPAFVGSPSVQGGTNFENSRHWILGRDLSNTLYIGFTKLNSSMSI